MAGAIEGVWKLKQYLRRFLDTGEVRNDMLPQAYILYTPGGFMMSITVEENRAPPASEVLTDEERLRLFKSIISAYSGRYTVEGDIVIHDVDKSWNEAWTGTKQMRLFKVRGDELVIETTPRTAGTDTREFVNTLTWQRTEGFPLVREA